MKKNNKKNVIWLHSHFLYWMGGTKFIHQVIGELKKHKQVNKIYVVVENTSGFTARKFKELGVELISLNSLTSNSLLYWLFFPIFLILDMVRVNSLIREKKLDKQQLTVYSSMFPMNVVAKFLGAKHVQNCYEPFAFFYDQDFVSNFSLLKRVFIKILAVIYSPLDKWATRGADKLLTLNKTTQTMIAEVYGVESIKTQAGVNAELFKPYLSTKIKKKYKGHPAVIHSTDYSPVKGTDRVIRAFALAAKDNLSAKLLITTTIDDPKQQRPYLELAKKLGIADRVEFLGFLPIEELPQYYTLARAMIQGAFSEKSGTTSMSLPVKEAMCCETPAIRPDVGGEDVVDGKTGFLVDPRDERLLASKISLLLNDAELSKKMGKQARKDIISRYNWQAVTKVFAQQL